jgi:hypothetical protein
MGSNDSLRHRYAQAALTGMLANPENSRRFDHEHMAIESLLYADAVIAKITQQKDLDVQPTPAIFAI